MSELVLLKDVLPWVKDLGLPVIALYYLFRVYVSRVDKTDKILDQYAEITQENTSKYAELTENIKELTDVLKDAVNERNKMFDRLIHRR